MIFDQQRILSREAKVSRSFEEYKADLYSNKVDPNRRLPMLEAISSELDAVNAALNFTQLVDVGADADPSLPHETLELFPGELVPVRHFRRSIIEFVNDCFRYEGYIICDGETREHSLMFIFAGEHGALACVRGLVSGSEQTYGLQMLGNGAGARSALLSCLSPPIALETSVTKFNSVALPVNAGAAAMVLQKYGAVLSFYLRSCCSKTDGRIEWERQGTLESLRSLADVGWWQKMPATKMILSAWSTR